MAGLPNSHTGVSRLTITTPAADADDYCMRNGVVAQFGIEFLWRNKFRPTTPFFVGPNLFGLVQTGPLPEMAI
jgi:hypothetical protein